MKWLKSEALRTAVFFCGIVWIYLFLAGGYKNQPYGFSSQSVRYYHLLVDGFLAGQTNLKLEPPPELAKLADPYDPAQRGDLGLHDGTYYKGRYYLYFGVGPAVALFLPFRLLTGVHFSENLAVGLFCAGGYLGSLLLFLGLRNRFFPKVTGAWVQVGTVLLGLANFCPVMLVRSDFWEVPIAGAFCFACLGLLALWQGTVEWPGARRWLWLSSAVFGLAVACRPHLLFAAAVLGFVWFWRWYDRRRESEPGRHRAADRDALALFVPLVAVVIGLLAYNYQRFDDPLEFGQKYQIGGVSMRHFSVLNWNFIPINFYFNFTATAQFARYFPFVEVIRGYAGGQPANYLGFENPYGVLPNLPVVWLALLAPAAWLLRARARGLGRWVLILGWHAAAITGMVLMFGGATNRYMVDFLPSFLLLAGVGLLGLAEWCRSRPRMRRALFAGAAGLTVYSSAFTLLAAVQYNGLFQRQHPELYASLAKWFNRPVYAWERWHGREYGPLQMTVTFPKNQPGRPEPLVITGVAFHSDYLYVIYDALEKSIKLAYDRTNYEHATSQSIPIDYNLPHRIGVESGALYPPVDHPFFRGWAAADVFKAKHTLRVTVDDVPYLVAEHAFFDATPGQVSVGENHLSDNGGRKFSGQIQSVSRDQPAAAVAAFSGGAFLTLAVIFPTAVAGTSEPLVATGERGHGDLLFVRYVDATHVRLGFHHAGENPKMSDILEIEPGVVQLLQASLGSFYAHPATTRERELAGMLVVRFNGRTIWLASRTFAADASPPAVGVNRWGSEACGERFSGRIVGQRAVPPQATAPESAFAVEPYWLDSGTAPRWGPVRMRLKLSAAEVGKIEPLLATGPNASQGDYLWINYPAVGLILIGYEHTGAGGPHSGLVPMDFSRPQILEVSLPSLYPPDTNDYFAQRPLQDILWRTTHAQLRLNGTVAFDAQVGAFESKPEDVTFGESRISEAFGKKFSGEILSIERGQFAPPVGLDANLGALEMILTRPETASRREVLLATGDAKHPDVLLIDYVNGRQIRFSAKTAAGATLEGKDLDLDPRAKHSVRIDWGGLYPDRILGQTSPTAREGLLRSLTVTVDDRPALSGQLEFQRAAPQPLWIGSAPGDESPFSGRIHSVQRLKP